MPDTITHTDERWEGLTQLLDNLEMQYFNQEDDYADSSRGEWYATDTDHVFPDGSRVIFGGTFANDHSPGSSHNTYAELYGPDELDAYNARIAELEAFPEYLETEPTEPEEGDYTTEDHRKVYQYGKLVLTIGENDNFNARIREHMEKEQYWPNVWWISDHGNSHLINVME